jgi:hypothetical protein
VHRIEHGADPTMKNQYGKSAIDLAKDEMASDERTVLKSHAEVRAPARGASRHLSSDSSQARNVIQCNTMQYNAIQCNTM